MSKFLNWKKSRNLSCFQPIFSLFKLCSLLRSVFLFLHSFAKQMVFLLFLISLAVFRVRQVTERGNLCVCVFVCRWWWPEQREREKRQNFYNQWLVSVLILLSLIFRVCVCVRICRLHFAYQLKHGFNFKFIHSVGSVWILLFLVRVATVAFVGDHRQKLPLRVPCSALLLFPCCFPHGHFFLDLEESGGSIPPTTSCVCCRVILSSIWLGTRPFPDSGVSS